MPSRVGPWLIALAIGAAAAFAILSGPGTPAPVGRGSPAPEFTLERLGGGAPVSLSALRGRVVLLNFWATWCKPCEDEMPAMERLYRALGAEGFELLAVSVDHDADEVRRFRERLGLSFPILLDPEQRVARAYLTFRFPESLLIDPDGVVMERYVGAKEWDAEAYVERIRRLLGRARLSPHPSAAGAHLRTLARDLGVRVLDAPAGAPAGPSPEISRRSTNLHALATRRGGRSGLGLPSGSAQGAGLPASRWGAREGNPGDSRPARLGAGARRAGQGGGYPALAAASRGAGRGANADRGAAG